MTVLTKLGLGRDIPQLEGKELRLQLTTYAPGAVGTPHSHEGKIEVVYLLSGSIIEHHQGGADKVYQPGDAFFANRDTFHHLENKGSVPAQLLVAMIVDKAP
ncbi:MAG TPA: cupin domain-containing protein [Xanthobacteraceae bacterium]|nr:cupin domain-containing protein [Xanthobacteraceae bacterium]